MRNRVTTNNEAAMDEKFVTITREEYDILIDESLFLDCLRNIGVDNWCGYDEACKEYNEAKNDSND